MLRKNILLAFRNIAKRKAFTFINIMGLTVGMTVCLLILTYARYEMSYDSSHPNADRIYRVSVDFYNNGVFQVSDAQCFPGAGPLAVAEFPEIESYCMVRRVGKPVFKRDNRTFKEDRVYAAHADWLTVFDWNLVMGNPETALKEAGMLVISESLAKKYFGEENPMGKIIDVIPGGEEMPMMVNGVFKDVPENHHLKFDALVSYQTLIEAYDWDYDNWNGNNDFLYLLSNKTDLGQEFEDRLNEAAFNKAPSLEKRGRRLAIQPLTDIHLKSDKTYEAEPNGNERIVKILIVVAVFVLIVAWVNYINLATARAMERGREVGVRKVLGSSKSALIRQFLVEAAFLNLIAVILTVTSIQLIMPLFSKLAGVELSLTIFSDARSLLQVFVIFIIGTLASGMYPSFVLSNFKPLAVLTGKLKDSQRGLILRKGLVVFQFLITMLLLVGTITIYQQVNHMRSQELGVNMDQTIVVENPVIAESDKVQTEKREAFRNELLRLPEVSSVAFTETLFGQGTIEMNTGTRIFREIDEAGKGVNFYYYRVDDQFLQTFDFKILAGRAFHKEMEIPYENDPGQFKGVIINETSRKLFGFESNEAAIGKPINRFGRVFNVIGVINDYNHHSLKTSVDPTLLFYDKYGISTNYAAIKVNTDHSQGADYKAALDKINAAYEALYPSSDFSFYFLDERFDAQYRADKQFGNVFTSFAVITIFVSVLGLFGLALYEIQQRIKEIGIRKVLGASAVTIIKLLSRDFIKLIGISMLLALPLAWWSMDRWLNTYAYRIELSWYLFVIPALVLLSIAMLTIIGQTLKVARRNPVDALRYE